MYVYNITTTSQLHYTTRVRVTWRILIWCTLGIGWVSFSALGFYHTYILCTYVRGFNYPINVSFWSHVGFFLRQEDRWRKTLVVWGQYDALQIALGVWFQRSSD